MSENWLNMPNTAMPEWWLKHDDTSAARSVRLAIIQNCYLNDQLTKEDAQELLNGPLTPGDDSTIYHDAEWLKTPEEIALIQKQQEVTR